MFHQIITCKNIVLPLGSTQDDKKEKQKKKQKKNKNKKQKQKKNKMNLRISRYKTALLSNLKSNYEGIVFFLNPPWHETT